MSTSSGTSGKSAATANWGWLAAYVIATCLVTLSMFALRRVVLRQLSTPEAIAQWQAWRDAEPNQSDTGPVKRRPPSSPEPPALVLLRDHFSVMLAGALLFSSLLFGAIMIAARGVFSSGAVANDADANDRGNLPGCDLPYRKHSHVQPPALPGDSDHRAN